MLLKKIIAIQIFLILLVAGLFVWYRQTEKKLPIMYATASSTEPLRLGVLSPPVGDTQPGSGLINPAVLADTGKHYIINFKPLRESLIALQKKQTKKTYIYFAYLNNSSWIGLSEKELFTAASTIKVPLAMTIAKMEEQNKLKATDTYALSDLDLDENFGTLYKVGANNSLTIKELVQIMLMHSDNTAMKALFRVMDLLGVKDPLAEIYNAMGWDYGNFGTTPTYIDINLKTLSNMFISLYNASYITVADSREILDYLTKSDFNEQIVAGVPKDVIVAHKIGVNDKDQTYSDCGIIYAPARSYLLCLGTNGIEKKASDAFMQEVSKTVYQYVINN